MSRRFIHKTTKAVNVQQ